MQLTYRGLAYPRTDSTVKTVDTGLTATFRGASYPLRLSQSILAQPQANLVYRGVGYNKGSRAAAEPVATECWAAALG